MVIYWRLSKIIWHKQFHQVFSANETDHTVDHDEDNADLPSTTYIWVCRRGGAQMYSHVEVENYDLTPHCRAPYFMGKPDCGFQFKDFKLPNLDFRVTWKSTAAKA